MLWGLNELNELCLRTVLCVPRPAVPTASATTIATAIEGNQEGCASQETSIQVSRVTFINAHHLSALDNLFTDTTYSIRKLIFILTNSSSATHMLSFLLPALPTLSVPCQPPYDLGLFSTIFYLILILLLLLWVFLTFSLSSLFPLSSFFSSQVWITIPSVVSLPWMSRTSRLLHLWASPRLTLLHHDFRTCAYDATFHHQIPIWQSSFHDPPDSIFWKEQTAPEFRLTTEPNIKTCTELHVLIPLHVHGVHVQCKCNEQGNQTQAPTFWKPPVIS